MGSFVSQLPIKTEDIKTDSDSDDHKKKKTQGESFFISIEGNIGAGKTSVVKELEHRIANGSLPEFDDVILEPIENYCNFKAGQKDLNPLNILYNSDKGGADVPICQLHFMRQSCYNNFGMFIHKNRNYICDRSFISTLFFLYAYSKLGYFSSFVDNYLLNEFLKLKKIAFSPDGFIYIKTPIIKCMDNINKRQRDSEDKITTKVLIALEIAITDILKVISRYFPVTIIEVQEGESVTQITDKVEKALIEMHRLAKKRPEALKNEDVTQIVKNIDIDIDEYKSKFKQTSQSLNSQLRKRKADQLRP